MDNYLEQDGKYYKLSSYDSYDSYDSLFFISYSDIKNFYKNPNDLSLYKRSCDNELPIYIKNKELKLFYDKIKKFNKINKNKLVNQLVKELEIKNKLVTELEIKTKNQNKLETELATKNKRVIELETELATKNKILNNISCNSLYQNKRINELENKLKSKDIQIKNKKHRVGNLENKLANKKKFITKLENIIHNKNKLATEIKTKRKKEFKKQENEIAFLYKNIFKKQKNQIIEILENELYVKSYLVKIQEHKIKFNNVLNNIKYNLPILKKIYYKNYPKLTYLQDILNYNDDFQLI